MYRRMIQSILALFCLTFVSCTHLQKPPEKQVEGGLEATGAEKKGKHDAPYLLLISVDGYRHDFTEKFSPPFLSGLHQNKKVLRSKALRPVYPSKTFPNHWSLITGLYADRHGIVDNSFLEKRTGRLFSLGSPEARKARWYKGEPFWITVRKNGIKSASFFWPGSDVDEAARRPDYYHSFDKNVPYAVRTDQIVSWLQLPEDQRPHFLTLYFSEVDTAGHDHGPDSGEMKTAVMNIDAALSDLHDKLQHLPIKINVVIVSDHGMQDTGNSRYIYLSDYTKGLSGLVVSGSGAISRVYTDQEAVRNELYRRLKKASHLFQTYRREEIPAMYHYRDDPNIGDLFLETDPPYYFLRDPSEQNTLLGNHGFNPFRTKTMGGIFYAFGPDIEGGIVPEFSAVHVFPFMAALMGVRPPVAMDGDRAILGRFLKP